MKLRDKLTVTALLVMSVLTSSSALASKPSGSSGPQRTTIETFLESSSTPFAIGHRGFGENQGEFIDSPLENTISAVRTAFRHGISMVEVDVSVTADGKAVVLHDDYLDDYTCVNSLSYRELKSRINTVPTLERLLTSAKRFSYNRKRMSGLVNIEIKAPSPLCDALDSTEQRLVTAVEKAIQNSQMEQQVIIESFSPAILNIAATTMPNIPRNLTVGAIQFLSQEEVEAITGLPVLLIDKSAGFDLQWAETGVLYRLPGYTSIDQFFDTVYLSQVQLVALDSEFLYQAELAEPGSAAVIIAQLHAMGVAVTVYTVNDQEEWSIVLEWGADGIYTDDIPLGVSLQGH